jgi:hypothetical protein
MRSNSGVKGADRPATDCGGIRKTMKYEISAGPFVLQVSGTREDRVSLAILPSE